MITIVRERNLAYASQAVWAVLAEPANLPQILARITQVKVGEPAPGGTPLTAHFDFGSQFGTRVAPGVFRTAQASDVWFESAKPLPIVAHWQLVPNGAGTLLKASLRFDLKPLLGPLAVMAPIARIKKGVAEELDLALKHTEALVGRAQEASQPAS